MWRGLLSRVGRFMLRGLTVLLIATTLLATFGAGRINLEAFTASAHNEVQLDLLSSGLVLEWKRYAWDRPPHEIWAEKVAAEPDANLSDFIDVYRTEDLIDHAGTWGSVFDVRYETRSVSRRAATWNDLRQATAQRRGAYSFDHLGVAAGFFTRLRNTGDPLLLTTNREVAISLSIWWMYLASIACVVLVVVRAVKRHRRSATPAGFEVEVAEDSAA